MTQKVEMIPIQEIRVVNPRSRSQTKFRAVMASIDSLGLKKPITVWRRQKAEDGTCFDLVCGQGRLESLKALGAAEIPAIVSDAPEDERYLMSLVENLARRQPSNRDLFREVRRLHSQLYKAPAIAEKLGMDSSYIYGILGLLKHGEDALVSKVEAGKVSLDIAITIAKGKDADIQKALSDAYDAGTLRGRRLIEAQRLVRQRREGKPRGTEKPISGPDLVKAYQHHTQQQRALVRRASTVSHRLAVITSCLRRLWADEHFSTLLRAEGLQSVPEVIANRLAAREGSSN